MAYLKWNALVITDVADYDAKGVLALIKEFREKYPHNKGLSKRSDKSYLNEWAVHALCCHWGIMRSRTKDADMEFEMEPEVKILYGVLGPIARLFLKLY